MNDTCGPTSGTPLAQYDPDERCWKTSEATSLWALTLSSLTLPPWGCLHGGELYELPTPALPTIEPGFSSLPTPMARDYKDLTLPPRLWGPKAYESELPTAIALHLMPTPKSSRGGAEATTIRPSGSKGSVNLEGAVAMLPTPRAQNGEPRNQTIYKRQGPQNLENALALLPTPINSDYNTPASEWLPDRERLQLRDIAALLPTPTAHPENTASAAWAYPTLLDAIGETTHPPLTAGSTSSDAQHQAPLFNAQDETA